MTVTLSLLVTGGVLVACGVLLLMARVLTRILLGTVLMSNGANVLLLSTTGEVRDPALLTGHTGPRDATDPLPQAMVLTAIVITLAMTGFLLAMAYRSWQLTGNDAVEDDVEDRQVLRRGEAAARNANLEDRYRAVYEELLLRRPGESELRIGHPLKRLFHRAERREYRAERRRLRRRIRAERARRVRALNPSGDLWDNVLGEDR